MSNSFCLSPRQVAGKTVSRTALPIGLLALALVFGFAGTLRAQSLATLTDLGANIPVAGANDVSQFSTVGNQTFPDGLNYYTDNQTGHNAGEPGQTFTTPAGAGGYKLTSLTLKSAGLDSGGGAPGAAISYFLHIYSVAGGSATPLATYTNAPVGYTEGHWLQWTGLSVTLNAGATYGWSFGTVNGGGGWEAIGVATNSPYAGGEIGLFLPAGGAIKFGASHQFDASCDVGLTALNSPPVVGQPTASPTNTLYAGSSVTFTANTTGAAPLYYQWLLNGFNYPGATTSTLALSSLTPSSTGDYSVVVTNAYGLTKSLTNHLTVLPAAAPFFTQSPASVTQYVHSVAQFSAAISGSPATLVQWLQNGTVLNDGGNLSGTHTLSVVISNLVLTNAGTYSLIVSNASGAATNLAQLVVNQSASAYENTVGAAGPVAYWRLNELVNPAGGTAVAHDYVGGFNGTYGAGTRNGFNSVTGPQPPAFPGFESTNTALQTFNGTANSQVSVPPINLNTNAVSITAWVFPVGNQANWTGIFMNRNGNDAAGLGFGGAANELAYTWNQNNGNTWGFASGLYLPTNQWSLVGLVITPAGATLYVYNAAGSASAVNAIAHTAEAFNGGITWIAGDQADPTGRLFNGYMDEVAVFNYSLTAAQMLQLYATGAGGLITWSAPQPITTADAVLNQSGTLLGAEVFGGTETIVTLTNGMTIDFKGDGSVAGTTGLGLTNNCFPADHAGATTGNAAFDAVLTQANRDDGPKTIIIKGLTPGIRYSAQLFALDDHTAAAPRTAYFQDPAQTTDTSATFTMGANVSVTGTFTALSTNQTIIEQLPVGGLGNLNALVLRSVTPVQIVNLPATAVAGSHAVLNGQVVSAGGITPSVTLYYGPANGGTSAAAWSNQVSLGAQSGAFSNLVTGLTANTVYYYTATATNSGGLVWAATAQSFTTTPAPVAPTVSTQPATNISGFAATLAGTVAATGGQNPTATIFYGPVDGGTTPGAWSNNVFLGTQTGAFNVTVTGLSPNTKYYFAATATNDAGIGWGAPSRSFTTPAAAPPVALLTYHNDNTRQGANTNELILTPQNVNTNNFGRLFTYPVDGHVYAAPLVMTNVAIPGQGIRNVVYAATEHDTVYAFDADSNQGTNGGLLWHTNLGVSAVMPNNDFGNRYGPYHDLVPEMGITSTPVIDPVAGTLYLDVFTHDGATYNHRIHALDITTGAERPGSPVIVAPSVPGNSVDSVGGIIKFNPLQHCERPALTLAAGMLYAAYASFADTDPYHGWVIGWNAATLQQVTNYVFNTTPNATTAVFGGNAAEGGIWMGGNGLSVDANTNLYFMVGNGSFNANNAGGTEYGDSFVRLSTTNGLKVADYFTPYNQAALSAADADLGSGGPLLLPDSVGSAAHPHLLVGCGKEGKIYLLDRENLGKYNAAADTQIVQEVPGAVGGTWSSAAYFNHFIYYIGSGDAPKAFTVNNATLGTAPASQAGAGYGFPGATPSISANGTNNAILWGIQADAYASGGPAVLHAYNAYNLAQELYNSSQNLTRDNPGGAVKMTVPTIANGKVYVGAEFALSVYGVATWVGTPAIAPAGGNFTNQVTVSFSDPTPGVAFHYTLDGTTPTAASALYTGALTVTNTSVVQVLAVKPGAVNSAVTSASFVNVSSLGNGTGLAGAYYANQTLSFNGTPILRRVDPALNFNWTAGGPDPSVGATNYTVRWTGTVQPQYSETYTFSVTADGGVRLWLNGQMLVNAWAANGVTTYTGTMALGAQQLYNLELDYSHGTGTAGVQFAWSSPSTPAGIVPQTQLYPYTNPPPAAVLTAPTNGAAFTASASVTLAANAAAQYNPLTNVAFYANGALLGNLTNAPYLLTATGLAAGTYNLTAVAADATGLRGTSAPVQITVNAGTGQPYGVAARPVAPAFYALPGLFNGSLPATLSQTGVFTNTAALGTSAGLLPYTPITPLWSDGAAKTRWVSVPYAGGLNRPGNQIGFAPTGEWSFPIGTVFVKHFGMVVDESNPAVPVRRLETRLLVMDAAGAAYGVTYKWRPDNSDADLITTGLNESLVVTNASGTRTQTWYYPAPNDCLQCHTPAANYVLGLKTRQLNSPQIYPATGVTDNQLRTLNHLGLFNPAVDESVLAGLTTLVSVSNTTATLETRVRSYLDANCAQCHRPGGTGPGFDARFDTALTNQNLIHATTVVPQDIWRSQLYQRADVVRNGYQMPPLARNVVDTNAMAVVAAWINSLPGTPALAPPLLSPTGGVFYGSVRVSLQSPATNSAIYYTLDGSPPTTNSSLYGGPVAITATAGLNASAFAPGFNNSVTANGVFTILPGVVFTNAPSYANGVFQMQVAGPTGRSYVLQASPDLLNWSPVTTNTPANSPFTLVDAGATNGATRFYRAILLP